MRCRECGGELKPIVGLFKRNGKFKETCKKAKEEYNLDIKNTKGYNCVKCGACYDEKFVRQPYNLAWLRLWGKK